MPELPEVEIWRRHIAPFLVDVTLTAVHVHAGAPLGPPLSAPELKSALVGHLCADVERHGKRLALRFRGLDKALVIQLGMTGRFHVEQQQSPPQPFERVRLDLDSGYAVVYADARRLGRLSWVPHADAFRSLGPDALATDPCAWAAYFAECRGPVKAVLLDQQRISGVGNIYASEGLYAARVHPRRGARTLSTAEWAAVAQGIQASMRQTLSRDGAGPLRYISANETRVNPFFVYGRAGEPCPTCGATFDREVLGGRGTFFCPVCQVSPSASA